MVSQYLLTHSKALEPMIKEIEGKMLKLAIYDPSLTPTGGSGGGGGGRI